MKYLQEYNFLVHLVLVIEDFLIKLQYHHRFHMCNIIHIIFPTFLLHHSRIQILNSKFFNYFNNSLELEQILIQH